MRRSRFTEKQNIRSLKEHEAVDPVLDLCRKHGVSDASIYNWTAPFGGTDVSGTRSIRGGIRRCALHMAPRLPTPPNPPGRAEPTAGTNSRQDRNWGQRQ